MKKMFFVACILVCASLATSAFAFGTRVDVNGVMNPPSEYMPFNPGQVRTDVIPEYWTAYGKGISGDLGTAYNTGSSSNSFAFRQENDGVTGIQGGYSLILGGSSGVAGAYGVQQSYASTAGKVYVFTGGAKYSGSSSVKLDFGIQNGSGIDQGYNTGVNYSSSLNGKRQFFSSVVATGDQVTYHIGHNVPVAGSAFNINTYADGIRVWEFDPVAQAVLQNAGFEGATTNLTEYNYDAADGSRDWVLPDGWIPMGTSMGKNEGMYVGDGAGFSSRVGNILVMDASNTEGRRYVMQRVNYGGAGNYDVSGWLYGWNAMAGNPLIGVDFSGGLDPLASSVVWSSGITAQSTWQQKMVSGFSATGAISIFLGNGSVAYTSANAGGAFDDIVINYTAVPEPSSMVALASGLIGMTGFVIRRRK